MAHSKKISSSGSAATIGGPGRETRRVNSVLARRRLTVLGFAGAYVTVAADDHRLLIMLVPALSQFIYLHAFTLSFSIRSANIHCALIALPILGYLLRSDTHYSYYMYQRFDTRAETPTPQRWGSVRRPHACTAFRNIMYALLLASS